jgi:hypothetical protein
MNSNYSTSRRRLIALVVSLAAASAAQADVITVNGSNVTLIPGSAASVSTGATGTSATGPTHTYAGTLGQFDPTLGVLTGAVATASVAPGNPATDLIKGGGTGSATARSNWSLGGNSSGQVVINTASGFTDAGWGSFTLTSSAGNLNNFVGAGNIATNSFASYISVQRSSGGAVYAHPGTSLTARRDLNYSESIAYTYLKHANASFSTGTDTNELSGSGLSFSVFNLGNSSDTTKLDFTGAIQCIAGNCSAFNVTMPSFQDLVAGSSQAGGLATLIAAAPGHYEASYRLMFSDDTSVGATTSQLQNSLTLNLEGSVAAVPEPAEWAMLLAGLVVIGFIAQRRNKIMS